MLLRFTTMYYKHAYMLVYMHIYKKYVCAKICNMYSGSFFSIHFIIKNACHLISLKTKKLFGINTLNFIFIDCTLLPIKLNEHVYVRVPVIKSKLHFYKFTHTVQLFGGSFLLRHAQEDDEWLLHHYINIVHLHNGKA